MTSCVRRRAPKSVMTASRDQYHAQVLLHDAVTRTPRPILKFHSRTFARDAFDSDLLGHAGDGCPSESLFSLPLDVAASARTTKSWIAEERFVQVPPTAWSASAYPSPEDSLALRFTIYDSVPSELFLVFSSDDDESKDVGVEGECNPSSPKKRPRVHKM